MPLRRDYARHRPPTHAVVLICAYLTGHVYAELAAVRALLTDAYGDDSTQVRNLDRHLHRLRGVGWHQRSAQRPVMVLASAGGRAG
jgi:hypothetical protein